MIFCFDTATVTTWLASAAVISGIWLLLIKPYLERKKPFTTLPMAKGSHWLMGHVSLLAGDPTATQNQLCVDSANKLGRTGYWTITKPSIAVTRWEDARAILNAESHRDANPMAKALTGYYVPKSLLFLNGREWKSHRAAVNKSFTPEGLLSSRQAMASVTETAVKSIRARIANKGHYQAEVEPIMKMITLDVFGQAAFSTDFGSVKNLEPASFAANFDLISTDTVKRVETNPFKPTNYFRSIPTANNIKMARIKRDVRAFVEDCIRERRDANASNKKKDLLTYLLDASDSADVSADALTDIIVTVLFAGYDTTSITLCYALHQISQNPDIEAKILEEVRSVSSIGDYDNLVYCKAVIQEALRLFPPAASTYRTIQKPITLPDDGLEVPAGTNIIIPIWSIHHSEENFARPMEFLPERWVRRESPTSTKWVERELDDTSSDVPAGNPKAFFPFSGGGRSCPGMKFAYQEAAIVLAGLLKDLRFEALPGYKLQPQRVAAIQHPHDRLPMKITLREP